MPKITDKTRMYDVLLRAKDAENGDSSDTAIMYPITLYDNCLGRPSIVSNVSTTAGGAPYLFRLEQHSINESEYSIYFSHLE